MPRWLECLSFSDAHSTRLVSHVVAGLAIAAKWPSTATEPVGQLVRAMHS